MGSTAKDRILEIDKYNNTLLKRKIKFSNDEYKTVEDYLIDVYPDNMDFYAEKIGPMLEARANEAEKLYSNLVNSVVENKLKDEKYNTPIRKDENWYMSFVEYIKSMPVGTIKADGVKFGSNILSFEDLYEKFAKDVYVEMDPELKNLQEPSEEEQQFAINQYKTRMKLDEIISSRGLNAEEIYGNTQVMTKIMTEFISSFEDFDEALANGAVVDGLNNIINNEIIMSQKSEDVKKVEEEAERAIEQSAVDKIDEIVPTPLGPSSSTFRTDLLNNREINAIINPGLSYTEQQRADRIVMSGPEEPEIEAGDGVEETTVYLNELEENKKIRS